MQGIARGLATRGVAPNAISVMSVVFAALGAGLIVMGGPVGFVLGALFCQLRLVCNLLDGLVALEGGRGGADGAFWNEVPDRVSDILLLAAAGVAAGQAWLGLVAAAGAVLTAYVREFGRAEGFAADYRGPMGKPQRMAVMTVALVAAAVEPFLFHTHFSLPGALWIVAVGTVVTSLRRGAGIVAAMKTRGR